MQYLAVCCVVKDEDEALKEWICYHSLLGVEHFVIYDNDSSVPVRRRLHELGIRKNTTVIHMPGKAVQMPAYRHCLETYGGNFKWIGFIDLDEFVCLRREKDLRVLLAEYESAAALGINWRMFGSNGHTKKPRKPVIAAYTQAFPEDTAGHLHIKTFLQPAKTETTGGPHNFLYKDGESAVTPAHLPIPIDSPFAPPDYSRIWLNHYFYKSAADWEDKLKRGRADVTNSEKLRRAELFAEHLAVPCVPEETILRRLKELFGALTSPVAPAAWDPCAEENSRAVLLEVADALSQQGDYDNALLCLNKASLSEEDGADLQVARARAARRAGFFEAAELFLNQALRGEVFLAVYDEFAALREAQGRREEAEHLRAVREKLNRLYASKEQTGLRAVRKAGGAGRAPEK